MPPTIPSVPGCDVAVRYRAASIGGALGRDIGGDWYDLIPLPGGRVGAVIGDVQGHDTHAAAVMGQLRIVLRAYAAEGHPPATVMARASVFLHELDTDRFATCLYAEADLGTGVVQVVRAGHIDPLLRAGDGSCRRVVRVEGGLPLGLSAEFGQPRLPGRHPGTGPRPHPAAAAPTAWSTRCRGPTSTTGMQTSSPALEPASGPPDVLGPGRPADRGGRGAAAATTTWRCWCCAAAAWAPPGPVGRVQQHVAPGRPGGPDRAPGT
ncbi:SpoIIE family protein phosphatase [Streptomyces violaceorubidus]